MYYLEVNNITSEYEIEFKCKSLDMLLEFCKQELTEFYDKQDNKIQYRDKDFYKTMLICNIPFIRFGIINKYTLSFINIRCKEIFDAVIDCIDEFFSDISNQLNNCECEKCSNNSSLNELNLIR